MGDDGGLIALGVIGIMAIGAFWLLSRNNEVSADVDGDTLEDADVSGKPVFDPNFKCPSWTPKCKKGYKLKPRKDVPGECGCYKSKFARAFTGRTGNVIPEDREEVIQSHFYPSQAYMTGEGVGQRISVP